MKSFNLKNQSGRSMIEMLGVLAIIGVLSVGGIAGYSKAMQKYRVNKTIEQITLVAGNVRSFFAPQGHYSGLIKDSNYFPNYTVIKKAKLVPDEMWNSSHTALENAFGGEFLLTAEVKGDNDRSLGIDENCADGCDAFSIYIDKIPEEACIELASQDWSSVGINVLERQNNFIYFVKSPLSVDEAVLFCQEIKDDGKIRFDFGLDVNSAWWKSSFEDCGFPDGC